MSFTNVDISILYKYHQRVKNNYELIEKQLKLFEKKKDEIFDDIYMTIDLMTEVEKEPVSRYRLWTVLVGRKSSNNLEYEKNKKSSFGKYKEDIFKEGFLQVFLDVLIDMSIVYSVLGFGKNYYFGIYNKNYDLRKIELNNIFKLDYKYDDKIYREKIVSPRSSKAKPIHQLKSEYQYLNFKGETFDNFLNSLMRREQPEEAALFYSKRLDDVSLTRESSQANKVFLDLIKERNLELKLRRSYKSILDELDLIKYTYDREAYLNLLRADILKELFKDLKYFDVATSNNDVIKSSFIFIRTDDKRMKNLVFVKIINNEWELLDKESLLIFNEMKSSIHNYGFEYSFYYALEQSDSLLSMLRFKNIYEKPIHREIEDFIISELNRNNSLQVYELLRLTNENYLDPLDYVSLFYRENLYVDTINGEEVIKKLEP